MAKLSTEAVFRGIAAVAIKMFPLIITFRPEIKAVFYFASLSVAVINGFGMDN